MIEHGTHAQANTQLYHTHLSRTPGRVRSADHLRPSLQQSDCLCHWRQPVTQYRECAVERLHQGAVRLDREQCVGVVLYLPFAFLLYSHRTSLGSQGAPLPREDRAVCARLCGLSVLTTAIVSELQQCRFGESRWKSAGNGCLVSVLPCHLLKLSIKEMDLR